MALKPIRTTDTTTTVSPQDQAVDTEHSDWEAYSKVIAKNPAAWRELIKAKDGQTLTEFIVGVIPTDQLVRVADECDSTGEEFRWRCFLHGLRDIKNWEGEIKKKTIDGVERVDPDWLRATFVRSLRFTALHVGAVAWWFNQLSGDEVKN